MGKSPSSKKENCPFNQLLGIFGSRYYHNKDAKLHKLFSLIENGENPMEGHIIDEQRCLQIREDLGIGQPLWDALRSALLPGVVLTSRYKLQNYAKQQYPPVELFLDGVWCPLSYVIPVTIKSMIESLVDDYTPSLDYPDSLELTALVVLKYDGSGNHTQIQGQDIDIYTKHLILSMLIYIFLVLFLD